MRKFALFVLVAALISTSSHAQKPQAQIRGKLIDTVSKQPIQDATISLMNATDSSLVTFTLTNKEGHFEFRGLNEGNYLLHISHPLFLSQQKNLNVQSPDSKLDVGELHPTRDYKTLGEVVVTNQAPIEIRGDTVQFNASAFKTKPNATVEDLLKKLPGVEVDKEGNIKAQGEAVPKVYVEGKEFFGSDPKLATKNLTAEMVESVQVFDDMSEQAKFTKIDDGSRTKAINIKLKKDRNKGFFGRALAAYGDQGRFKANVSMNRFRGPERLSVLFNANNVNELGFSFSDIISSMGGLSALASAGSGGMTGAGGLMGGGMQMISTRGAMGMPGGFGSNSTGIIKSVSTGLNYSNEWSSKLKATGSYFFSNSDNEQAEDMFQRSSFPGDSVASLSRSFISTGVNQNHRINFRLEAQLDSLSSILFIPGIIVQRSENFNTDTSFTMAELPGHNYLVQTGTRTYTNERDGLNWNNNLLYRKRFRKAGRTITLGWANSFGQTESGGFNISNFSFFSREGELIRSLPQNQENSQTTNTHNNVISTSYTEPLGKNKIIEFNYAYTLNNNTSNKTVYNFDPLTNKYDDPNLALTNEFENSFKAHRFGTNFRVQTTKYNYQLGIGVQRSTLESFSHQALTNVDSTIKASYTNFFPTANFNFTPNRGRTLRISYNGRTNQPSISQLQNVADVTDPLNVRIGNPALRQEFSHNFTLSYHSFNILTFKYISANVNVSTTSNRIVNAIDTITRNVQLIRPVNMNGYYRMFSFVTVGIPFRNAKWRGSSVNFSTNAAYMRDVSLLYKQENIGKTITISQRAGLNLSREKWSVGVSGSLTYTDIGYSVNEELSEDYFTQTYSADVSINLPKNFILSTDFDYYINTGRADGFNQSIPMWNAMLSKQVFKKKNGEIRISINDILNQNQSINRTNGDNYIRDTRSMVLRRYFLISFLFNISRMGGKDVKQPALPAMIERNIRSIRVN